MLTMVCKDENYDENIFKHLEKLWKKTFLLKMHMGTYFILSHILGCGVKKRVMFFFNAIFLNKVDKPHTLSCYLKSSTRQGLGVHLYSNQIKATQILFVWLKIQIYTLSHWALTNYTDVAPFALRPLNWVRKSFKKKTTLNRKIRNLRKNHRRGIILPRTDRHAMDVTCTEHNNMIITVHLECIKHP